MSSSASEKDQEIRDKQAELEESESPRLGSRTPPSEALRLTTVRFRSLRSHLAALPQGQAHHGGGWRGR